MRRPHPLTALSEREWAQAWEAEQAALDELESQRGSWLPNVVEARNWGAVRWTSGRPSHAAATGQAAAESFAVLRPDLTNRSTRARIFDALRDVPPVRRVLGFGFREHHIRGAVIGAIAGGVIVTALVSVLVGDPMIIIGGALVGLLGGTALGVLVKHYGFRRRRAAVLGDRDNVRLVVGRYAPPAWTRLVEAATQVAVQAKDEAEPDNQSKEAVHRAMWEAAGLLLSSSDHTGVEVLAEGVERLVTADRGHDG